MAGSKQSRHRQLVMSALDQCEGALRRYAARMLRNEDTAEDVVQHAFLQLCSQTAEQFPKHPKSWLFKVCRNRILDLLRQAGRQEEVRLAGDRLPSETAADPAALVERKDLGAWMQTLVDQLPPSQREVIVLWCQGFRYGEIAEITDQTEGGVRVKAHRGFVRLRKHPAVCGLLALENTPRVAAGASMPQKDSVP